MTASFFTLVARDESGDPPSNNTTTSLLHITLLVLFITSTVFVASISYIRYRKRYLRASEVLPQYEEKSSSSSRSNHRRSTAFRPTQSVYVYQERQNLLASSDAPPSSSVPEIRITLPEEVDSAGKRQSGRVVIVHVGETSTGMEPYTEKLPPYQESESDRFQSLDLDRMGGLKEKEQEVRWS